MIKDAICMECKTPLKTLPSYLATVKRFLCKNHWGLHHYDKMRGRMWSHNMPSEEIEISSKQES